MDRYKTFDEAAKAVDELFSQALQTSGGTAPSKFLAIVQHITIINLVKDSEAEAEDSGDESDDDRENDARQESEDEDDETQTMSDSLVR